MKTPLCLCPCCDRKLDATRDIEGIDDQPKTGDVSICLYCTTLLEFDAELNLVEMTEEQIGELSHDIRRDLQRTRRAIETYYKLTTRKPGDNA